VSREFLEKNGDSEVLYFYLEATDFKQTFESVLADTTGEEKESRAKRNFRYFLMRSDKIYDKYLKLGSPLRVG
jgi:hypothetical protein